MPRKTRPVSIRVPADLPDQVKAITGMTFSKAVTTVMEAFVESRKRAALAKTVLAETEGNQE